jgi:hypothetical protein
LTRARRSARNRIIGVGGAAFDPRRAVSVGEKPVPVRVRRRG